jgi:hypothetical protein
LEGRRVDCFQAEEAAEVVLPCLEEEEAAEGEAEEEACRCSLWMGFKKQSN